MLLNIRNEIMVIYNIYISIYTFVYMLQTYLDNGGDPKTTSSGVDSDDGGLRLCPDLMPQP